MRLDILFGYLTIGNMDITRLNVYMIKEVNMHKAVVALRGHLCRSGNIHQG